MTDADQKAIEALRRKRGNIKGTITRLEVYGDNLNNDATAEDICIRLELLEKAFNEFKEIEDRLTAYPMQPSELGEVEERYIMLKAKFRKESNKRNNMFNDLHQQFSSTMKTFVQQQQEYFNTLQDRSFALNSGRDEIKLPKISIPPFYGNYADFPSFKDLFEATIHNNESLSKVHKFKYLKGLLGGEAANIVKHVTISDANYESTWEKIVKRYDHKDHIMANLIRQFLAQPRIHCSSKEIRRMVDTTDEVLRGLAALGDEAETRDGWLIYLLLEKCDEETRKAWALKAVEKQFPKINEFTTFLNDYSNALERAEPLSKKIVKPSSAITSANVLAATTCPLCDQQHLLHRCERFLALDVSSRRGIIAEKKLCFNCMRGNHRSDFCKLKMRCFKCNRKHNVLLHSDDINKQNRTSSKPIVANVNTELPVNAHNSSNSENSLNNYLANLNIQAILPTAIVNVKDGLGQKRLVRVLLDSGSQASFIDERFFNQLHLPKKRAQIPIAGLATSGIVTKGVANLDIISRFSNSGVNAETFILEKLPVVLPSSNFDSAQLKFISDLNLADPDFYKTGKIDMLLGADVFFNVLRAGKKTNSDSSVIAQNTMFGYIVSGKSSLSNTTTEQHISLNLEFKLDEVLKRFWEIEEPPTTKKMSPEEIEAENHFSLSVQRDSTGRFIVKIPFKENLSNLGNSLNVAEKRFYNLERKLKLNKELRIEYKRFMAEYLDLKHMEEIAERDILMTGHKCFYLPHHAVVKTSSTTTKIRVVFDGSSRSSTGIALNDTMMIGPTIQSSLWDILLRFRTHKYVVTADVEKMYRQVRVTADDANYQRILWRSDPDEKLKHFKLITVTYGTASAPFLATRCLFQLALDNMINYPEAANIIKKDFYVDDLLTGCNSIDSMLKLKNNISEILKSAGFELRKWSANSTLICENDPIVNICDDRNAIKILGLQWFPQCDYFSFKVKNIEIRSATKRSMLSDTSTIFDPLGWLSPSTILVKILFQQLWLQKLDWDDELPDITKKQYIKIRNEFPCFENLKISRWIQCSGIVEFHVFVDASEKAYAAAVYCRSICEQNIIRVSLMTAKTKVAPIKQKSLPRLELCAAVLGTTLLMAVSNSMQHIKHSVFAWTDSSIVLSWLSDHPSKWACFVGNRTSQILSSCPREKWSHVKSSDNPADIATRGLFPSQLGGYNLWWQGPEWLSQPRTMWPKEKEFRESNDAIQIEMRKKCTNVLHTQLEQTFLSKLISKFSSYPKLIRILARINRFAKNFIAKYSKNKHDLAITLPYLTSLELSRAEEIIIQYVQQDDFKDDIRRLRKNLSLEKQSSLKSLNPLLDENGTLRVGGRLERASCSFATKHPIILHKNSILSKIIVTYIHLKFLHPGPSLTFHILRQKFWIINGRSMVNHIVKQCVTCARYRGKSPTQLMGQLPKVRVSPARPFENTGVDFTGAIALANRRGRGAKMYKGYIAIFICLVTKAIHIEVVTDCTTDGFIAALRRFIARRGVPSNIHSDNGSNFVGADRKLQRMYQTANRHQSEFQKLTSSNEFIKNIGTYLSENRITWHYTPPLAPHFAGIWESAVKSVKTHLVKATGNIHFTYEELTTLLCNIEAILNSRPITISSTSDESYEALTPAHFLIGAPITSLPEPYAENSPVKLSKMWGTIQQRTFTFWKRFSCEYLHNLQQRNKWQIIQHNLKIGDVVLLKEQFLPPCKWVIGRIKEVHPGEDGHVRVVTIKTANSEYKRPLNKVVLLPVEDV